MTIKWFAVGLIVIGILGLIYSLTIAGDYKAFGVVALYTIVYIAVRVALADRDTQRKKQTGVRKAHG